jgi:hypothetical protein
MFLKESIYRVSEQTVFENAKGQFAARILVLVFQENNTSTPPIEFVEKVLTAAKVDINNDALLKLIENTDPIRLFPISLDQTPTKIIAFGIEPAQLGLTLNFQWYQPFQFSDITFLFAEKTTLLENDRDRKLKLWNALKSIFA